MAGTESRSVFNTLSDPYLSVAFWVGVGALALTLLLSAQIVFLRVQLRRFERRERAVIAKWRPVLSAAIAGEAPAALPSLPAREQLIFLKLWLHLRQSVRGDAGDALNAIACRLRVDVIALPMLQKERREEKLLAILILGHLQDAAAWDALLQVAAREDSVLSIQALWALTRIDAHGAVSRMLMPVLQRDDWALSQLATIFQDARDVLSPALAEALPAIAPAHLPRALRLAEALRITLPARLLAGLLQHDAIEVVIAALRLAEAPETLPAARALAGHQDWRVRVQVARALGRIGDARDMGALRRLLEDGQWWVRYRAGQALVALPFLGAAEIEHLSADTSDRYARDMLQQVLAERASA